MSECIQEKYAPNLCCYGCGPANKKGLRLRSFRAPGPDEVYVARWRPAAHHEAYPGVLNGGIIGSLLDCHSNWTAAMHLMGRRGLDWPPVCVTADYQVTFKRPTPSDQEVELSARVEEASDRRAVVVAELSAGGKICATCRGTFVAVSEGHPAYHRW